MKVWKLLDAPAKWCQEIDAMDFEGVGIDALNPDAVCWCLEGALERCYYDVSSSVESQPNLQRAREKVIDALDEGNIISWNDAPERTFEEVAALVRRLDI